MSFDPELEDFKQNIDLEAFAASRGYALDRAASYRGTSVMVSPAEDKVSISVRAGKWVFKRWNPKGKQSGGGSILDFVQDLEGCSLGRARQILREYRTGTPGLVEASARAKQARLLPVEKDLEAVRAAYEAALPCFKHPFLEGRGVGADLLLNSRLKGFVRAGELVFPRDDGTEWRTNAVLFPHYNRSGLCGFEARNIILKGFARGGEKGLWRSAFTKGDNCLVIAEAALDAISYFALHGHDKMRLLSTGGTLNPEQPALIREVLDRLAPGSVVAAAFDNDDAGERLAAEIGALMPGHVELKRHKPEEKKDWNDVLMAKLGLKKPLPAPKKTQFPKP